MDKGKRGCPAPTRVCGGIIIITNLYMMFNVSKTVTVTLPSPNIKLAVAQIIIFRLSYSMVRIAELLISVNIWVISYLH